MLVHSQHKSAAKLGAGLHICSTHAYEQCRYVITDDASHCHLICKWCWSRCAYLAAPGCSSSQCNLACGETVLSYARDRLPLLSCFLPSAPLWQCCCNHTIFPQPSAGQHKLCTWFCRGTNVPCCQTLQPRVFAYTHIHTYANQRYMMRRCATALSPPAADWTHLQQEQYSSSCGAPSEEAEGKQGHHGSRGTACGHRRLTPGYAPGRSSAGSSRSQAGSCGSGR